MTSAVVQADKPPRPATLGALAEAFLRVSLFGFGGGLIWARRIVVEQRHWLSEAEFLDIVSLCQFLPGPNILGIAVCTGAKLRGSTGAAAAAVAGFLTLPWCAGLTLGVLCLRYAQNPVLHHILAGVSAVAAGLLAATGLRLLLSHRRRPAIIGLAALTFALVVFVRWPILVVLPVLLPFGLFVAARGLVRAS